MANNLPLNTSPFDVGPNLDDPTSPPQGVRDWYVLEAVAKALEDTEAFDEVALSQLPEDQGRGASLVRLAVVQPADWDELDDADGTDGPENVVKLRFTLTILVRATDPASRDREVDRLLNVAKNAINGADLLPGRTIPGLTKLRKGKWLEAVPPERRMAVVGESAYGFDGNDQHDNEE